MKTREIGRPVTPPRRPLFVNARVVPLEPSFAAVVPPSPARSTPPPHTSPTMLGCGFSTGFSRCRSHCTSGSAELAQPSSKSLAETIGALREGSACSCSWEKLSTVMPAAASTGDRVERRSVRHDGPYDPSDEDVPVPAAASTGDRVERRSVRHDGPYDPSDEDVPPESKPAPSDQAENAVAYRRRSIRHDGPFETGGASDAHTRRAGGDAHRADRPTASSPHHGNDEFAGDYELARDLAPPPPACGRAAPTAGLACGAKGATTPRGRSGSDAAGGCAKQLAWGGNAGKVGAGPGGAGAAEVTGGWKKVVHRMQGLMAVAVLCEYKQ